jgi:hypothetical protein
MNKFAFCFPYIWFYNKVSSNMQATIVPGSLFQQCRISYYSAPYRLQQLNQELSYNTQHDEKMEMKATLSISS